MVGIIVAEIFVTEWELLVGDVREISVPEMNLKSLRFSKCLVGTIVLWNSVHCACPDST